MKVIHPHNQGVQKSGLLYYWLLMVYLSMLGGVLPTFYIYLAQGVLTEYYFTIDMIDAYTLSAGNIYTVSALVVLWWAAWWSRPRPLTELQLICHQQVYSRYSKILFFSAIASILISITLSAIYGMSQSNLVAQRPQMATWLGYLSRILLPSVPLYIGYHLMIYGRFSRRGMIVLLLLLADLALSWSRSGLMVVAFIMLFSSGYAFLRPVLRWRHFLPLVLLSVVTVILGQYMRVGDDYWTGVEFFERLYFNNQVLYMAILDHGKIFRILTDGQPWVILDQLFSFLKDRTLMPSSFRLLEYWGGYVVEDSRGHIAGYAYGWLGLTYGLLGWWGLILLMFFFMFVFRLLNYLRNRPGLFNMVLFFYVGNMLLEVFSNLGLDSYAEKTFKGLLSAMIFAAIMRFIYTVVHRVIQKKNTVSTTNVFCQLYK